MWSIPAAYQSAFRKKDTLIHIAVWVDLENIHKANTPLTKTQIPCDSISLRSVMWPNLEREK